MRAGRRRARAAIDRAGPDRGGHQLATLLDSRQGAPLPPATPWFETLRGTQPVIVTAPHATRPFREGRYGFAHGGGTGALAQALHATCGATVLYNWSFP